MYYHVLSMIINVHSLQFASNLRLERPAASWGGPFSRQTKVLNAKGAAREQQKIAEQMVRMP